MEKIVITGGKGQLGSELARCLKRRTTELGRVPLFKTDYEYTVIDADELDITDEQAVRSFFAQGAYTTIINCAAFTNVNLCESEEEKAYQVNKVGAENLAKAAQAYNMKLIHVSTDYVFAGNGSRPYLESEATAPQSAYGRTKEAGERAVMMHCSRYFIVRTAWLYGYTGNNFVKTMMKLGRERGAVSVVNDQYGNPTNAADLAYHLLKLVTSDSYGIYHGTGLGICSWYEFACKIMEYAGIQATVTPCTTEEYMTPAKRPAYSALDHYHFEKTVGYAFRPWEEALHYFIEHLDQIEGEAV